MIPRPLNAWRPTSPAAALGLSVEYLSQKPAFAALPFGEWSQVLFYQVARGHYLFVVDGEQRIRGFLGWALTDRAFAEEWVAGRAGLRNESGEEGDCVIVNAWAAEDERAQQSMETERFGRGCREEGQQQDKRKLRVGDRGRVRDPTHGPGHEAAAEGRHEHEEGDGEGGALQAREHRGATVQRRHHGDL